MSITLELSTTTPELTTLDGLRVRVVARNSGVSPVSLPNEADLSAALTLEARQGSQLVRVASGMTQQDMMNVGRADPVTRYAPLAPSEERVYDLDLTRYQYPLPAGVSTVHAQIQAEDGTTARSNALDVTVQEAQVERVSLARNNPILDGVTLLLESGDGKWRQRLYNTRRPLAAWYGEELPVPVGAQPMLATPTYFRTDSFDHFFTRWLLFVDEGELSALLLVNGRASADVRSAVLAPGQRVLAALSPAPARVLVFLSSAHGELTCHELTAAGLELRFVLPVHGVGDASWLISGRLNRIVLARARSGVERIDLDETGQTQRHEHEFNTDLTAFELRFDPVEDAIKAAFWDGPQGEHLQLVNVDGAGPRVFYSERSGALRDIREFAWAIEPKSGRPFAVANTGQGLYLWSHGETPSLIADPGSARLPLLIAQKRPYVGFWSPGLGYNFYEYRHGQLRLPGRLTG
jgi:hypothetical protein